MFADGPFASSSFASQSGFGIRFTIGDVEALGLVSNIIARAPDLALTIESVSATGEVGTVLLTGGHSTGTVAGIGIVNGVAVVGNAVVSIDGNEITVEINDDFTITGTANLTIEDVLATLQQNDVATSITNFDFEAVKDLYSRERIIYIEAKDPRIVFVEPQDPRIVYVGERPNSDNRRYKVV